MRTKILQLTTENIALAAAEIQSGGLVAFATETVYGLGADAFNAAAVKKIFEVKGRPPDNPLIVHFADFEGVESAGYFDSRAFAVAKAFMPGPLTVVVKKRECVPDIVTAGLSTVAIRIPASPLVREFIKKCGVAIAAPSANTSTRPSPTTARHVLDDLCGKIKYVLDGGDCDVGLESTIIDFSVTPARLLRAGGVALEELEKLTGKIEVYNHGEGQPLSPGMKYRHYAPNARVRIFEDLNGLKEGCAAVKDLKTLVLGVNLGAGLNDFLQDGEFKNIEAVDFKDEINYAAGLYSRLREADKQGCKIILALLTNGQGIGRAVNNRLFKAAEEKGAIDR
ncbi:MAG: L-threonylcarbamoyladenylate synthase [Firmicutes bacterium]|nr:L-threonylcarbamoyladenylate synthase [Bacillota bacterium]